MAEKKQKQAAEEQQNQTGNTGQQFGSGGMDVVNGSRNIMGEGATSNQAEGEE